MSKRKVFTLLTENLPTNSLLTDKSNFAVYSEVVQIFKIFFSSNYQNIFHLSFIQGGHKLVPVEDETDLNIYACYDRKNVQ